MDEGVASHVVRPEERAFQRRAEEWADQSAARHRPILTDFLSPREQVLLARLAVDRAVMCHFDGGYVDAERKRALLLPAEWPVLADDFRIVILTAALPSSAAVSHGSVLGSVLGTGVQRHKIGDIAVFPKMAAVVATRDMEPFLSVHWRAVGRIPVEPRTAPPDATDVAWPIPVYVRDLIDLVSIRADATIAHACRLSRSKAQEAIARKQVLLNFAELTDADCRLAEGDILSVRGFGRIRVFGQVGETRSGRARVEIGILRSNST